MKTFESFFFFVAKIGVSFFAIINNNNMFQFLLATRRLRFLWVFFYVAFSKVFVQQFFFGINYFHLSLFLFWLAFCKKYYAGCLSISFQLWQWMSFRSAFRKTKIKKKPSKIDFNEDFCEFPDSLLLRNLSHRVNMKRKFEILLFLQL